MFVFQLSFFQCRADDKIAVLLHLLKNVIKDGEQTVVFAATKHHVEYLNMVSESFNKPFLFELVHEKTNSVGFRIMSDTNQAVQSQHKARSLKLWI